MPFAFLGRLGTRFGSGRASRNFLVINKFGIIAVQVGDKTGLRKPRAFEHLLHGLVGTVGGGKKLVPGALILQSVNHCDGDAMTAHLGMNNDQIDEMMAVEILGPDQETRRDAPNRGDKNPLFPDGGIQMPQFVPLGSGGLVDFDHCL